MNPDMNAGCYLGLFRANTKESLALGNLQDVEGPNSIRMHFSFFLFSFVADTYCADDGLLLAPCSRLYVVLGINWACQHES